MLLNYRDDRGDDHPVLTVDDWFRRRAHILAGFQQAAGPLPSFEPRVPLDVHIMETVADGNLERIHLDYVARPGSRVPAYLLLPKLRPPGVRLPAMLALHQTTPLGKDEPAGLGPKDNLHYGRELAERGYAVLIPDYPSFGELANYDFAKDHDTSGTMTGIVNHIRGVDLLCERPEVDPERIGVIGHSLGGHNAIFVGMFDERLKVIVSSCGWTPFHDYYGGNLAGWTSDRYMPRLRDEYRLDPDRVPFDFPELIGALAPRAFFSNSPQGDENFAVAGVEKGTAAARRVYELYGAADRLVVRTPEGGHDFSPEIRNEAYDFIDRVLKPR